jgi:hypothetical protein
MGDAVRRLRESRGLTKTEFAGEIGLPDARCPDLEVHEIETGQKPCPPFLYPRIVHAFDVSAHQLVGLDQHTWTLHYGRQYSELASQAVKEGFVRKVSKTDVSHVWKYGVITLLSSLVCIFIMTADWKYLLVSRDMALEPFRNFPWLRAAFSATLFNTLLPFYAMWRWGFARKPLPFERRATDAALSESFGLWWFLIWFFVPVWEISDPAPSL